MSENTCFITAISGKLGAPDGYRARITSVLSELAGEERLSEARLKDLVQLRSFEKDKGKALSRIKRKITPH